MPTPILRVILSNLTKKPFTNLFPKRPPIPIPEGFRGLPTYNPDKCVGCRMCVTVCPTRTIIYVPEKKKVRLWVARCLACGLCAEVCPTKAISMSNDWLLATNNKHNKRLVLGPVEREEKRESNNKQRFIFLFMKSSYGKKKYGISKERALVSFFWKMGIPAIRSPASGAAASTPRPDVIIFSYGKILCLECKYSRGERAYYRWSDWRRTYEFSRALKDKGFLSEAYLVFNPSGREKAVWIRLTEEMYQRKAKITLQKGKEGWKYTISFEKRNRED